MHSMTVEDQPGWDEPSRRLTDQIATLLRHPGWIQLEALFEQQRQELLHNQSTRLIDSDRAAALANRDIGRLEMLDQIFGFPSNQSRGSSRPPELKSPPPFGARSKDAGTLEP